MRDDHRIDVAVLAWCASNYAAGAAGYLFGSVVGIEADVAVSEEDVAAAPTASKMYSIAAIAAFGTKQAAVRNIGGVNEDVAATTTPTARAWVYCCITAAAIAAVGEHLTSGGDGYFVDRTQLDA